MRVSLRFYLPFITALLFLITASFLLLGSTYFFYTTAINQLVSDKEAFLKFVKESIYSPMFYYRTFSQFPSLKYIVYEEAAKNPGVVFLRVVDPGAKKIIWTSVLGEKIGAIDQQAPYFSSEINLRDGVWLGQPVKEIFISGVASEGLWMGVSLKSIREAALNIAVKQGLIVLVILLVIYSTFYFILRKMILIPLEKVHYAIGQVQRGNFDAKIDAGVKTEIGNLANIFNDMTRNLKKSHSALEQAKNVLEIKVKELEDSDRSLSKTFKDLGVAKEKADEEKEKTMALISNFSAPIIFLNNDNKLALFNPSAREILGVSAADLGAEVADSNNFSLNNFVNIIHNKFSVEKLTDEQAGIKLEEATVRYKNENRVYKVITSQVSGKNGDYLGVMKIFYDTTREKAIDKMKSEFISVAAHQLRTPLSAIKWVIKMILDGDAGKLSLEQQELLNKGYLSNERIIRLVNDLLNVSRIEEGKFGFNFEKVDFLEVLSTAISNVESLAAKNHQNLTITKPPKLPKIFLDKERMVMVLQNLLSNAIKYTPEYGKIQVIIEVDKQNLHVKINDQGVGIPAEDQPKLFSKFFRAANVVKLETEGTGLGLFMVKNIIEKHNGKVSLESEEGKGTEVSFFIPINRAANL